MDDSESVEQEICIEKIRGDQCSSRRGSRSIDYVVVVKLWNSLGD